MRIFRGKQFEANMDAELRFHIEARVNDLVQEGLTPAEAERLARTEFGAIEARKDECRQAWGLQWIDELRADLRFTFRTLSRSPGFAAVAVVSLALGIGANTAIFGLIDVLLLQVLPVREPGRLVFLQSVGTQGPSGGPPYPYFELLRSQTKTFEGMAAFSASAMELSVDGGREQVRGVWVSGNFYELLGIKPILGRALSATDDETVGKGGPDGPVAVISRAYWQQRFAGDSKVVGRGIRMYGKNVTIVGVMPSEVMSLEPGRPIDIAAPMMLSDPAKLRERGSWWLEIVARLKPDIQLGQARAESNALFHAYMADIPTPPDIRKLAFDHTDLTPAGQGMDGLRRRFSKPLIALIILAGLVLFAACVNVASLLLARGAARQKEFAVRLALGAGTGRLIRQTLTESLVLVSAGSVLGILIAIPARQMLAAFFAGGNNPIILDLSLSGRLLFFTLATSLLTGVAFGIAPALRAASIDPAVAGFQGGSRTVAGNRRALRLGRLMVILQISLSMFLLAGAGLFIRSLSELKSVDRGFTREATLTMEVTPEQSLFDKPEWLSLQTEILGRVHRIPTVRAASWSTMNPLTGRDRGALIDVPRFLPHGDENRLIHVMSVSPEYFETLGVPLVLGREFSERDDGSAPKVAILNETAARFYFGKTNPVGERVRFAVPRGGPDYEIVGVVKDARHANLRDEPWRFIYLPIPQSDRINRLALAVRTSLDASMLAAPITKEIRTIRPGILVANVATMEQLVQRSMLTERLVAALSAVFGILALVLAGIGLYGILAYAVTRRTSEIGIRMALGATRIDMIWLVLREALFLSVTGIVIGLPAVVALGRFSRALLYGVDAFDPLAFVIAAGVLLVFATMAGIVPARRASRLDPTSALKSE